MKLEFVPFAFSLGKCLLFRFHGCNKGAIHVSLQSTEVADRDIPSTRRNSISP